MFGARPGRRLWVCRAATAGELSEAKVLATVRPSIPEASAPPGSRLPAPTAPVPKKWEFGALHALGPCVLSVSEKAIAVVDVVSAAVLAWYPLAPPRGRGRGDGEETPRNAEGVGAPRDLVTRGARAFALGADGGVWCLRAPANEAQLAAASAALGVSRRAAAMSRATTARRTPRERRRARRIRRRIWNASRDEYGPSTVRADRRRRHRSPRREMRRAMSILRGGRLRLLPRSGSGRQKSWPTTFHQETSVSASVSAPGPRRARRRRRRPRSGSTRARATRATRDAPPPVRPRARRRPPADVAVPGDGGRRGHRRGDREDAAPAERSAEGETANARPRRRRRGAGEEDRRDDDDDDDEARVFGGDAGASEPLREADRALREDARGDDLGEESARSPSRPSRMVESEDTPASSEAASPASEVSADRDRNRDPPPRMKTRPEDEGNAASPSSPSSPSGSGISAPESPRATETNQLFPADLNPWWMRLIGCGGCGPVRSNKQEKGGLGMRW